MRVPLRWREPLIVLLHHAHNSCCCDFEYLCQKCIQAQRPAYSVAEPPTGVVAYALKHRFIEATFNDTAYRGVDMLYKTTLRGINAIAYLTTTTGIVWEWQNENISSKSQFHWD